MSDVRIRAAAPHDIVSILEMIRELAEYERDPDAVVATPELLQRALFGESHVAYALMAEDGSGTLGFALYFFNFSTWTGRPGLYLEDFYVRPHARGRGIGESMFACLARIARERGCGRMELAVLDWNVNAIRLYERLGGVPMKDWTVYRFTPDVIARIAERAPTN
ncbi:MAG TPA: GNAT family N-acetyltransferase [Candidatus Elarobacter sp.]|nr:GNAT family N-acetyltransferase [Candidatus Elarobacter sp.]